MRIKLILGLLLVFFIIAGRDVFALTITPGIPYGPGPTWNVTLGEAPVMCYNIHQPCVEWIYDGLGNKINAVSGVTMQAPEGQYLAPVTGAKLITANAEYTVEYAANQPGHGQMILNLRVRPLKGGLFTVTSPLGSAGGIRFNVTEVYAVPNLSAPANNASGSFSVGWNAVSLATRYELSQSVNGGAWTTIYDGPGSTFSLSGLGNGSYSFRIRACGISGCSDYSAVATTNVLWVPAVPALTAPENNVSGAFTLSWTAVATTTSYQLDRQMNAGAWQTILNANVLNRAETGLGSGTYNYRLRACNASGCSANSAVVSTVVLLVPTGTPTLTVPASNTTGGFSVGWTAVAGAASYQLDRRVNGGSWVKIFDGNVLTRAESGLASDTYDYRVRACNASGCGPNSAAATVDVLRPPADAPSTLSAPATNTTGSFGVTWSSAAGATFYQLEQQRNGGSWSQVLNANATSHGVSVPLGGTYGFRVRACNASGCSDYSSAVSTVVELTPVASGEITSPATSNTGAYIVAWGVALGAESYELERRLDGGAWTTLYAGSAVAYEESGRGNGSHDYRVRGCHAGSCGAYSNITTTVVALAPAAPAGLTGPANTATGAYAVSWDPVTDVTGYELQERYNGSAWATIYSGTATSQSLAGRLTGSFDYQVRACNAASCGVYSPLITVAVAAPSINLVSLTPAALPAVDQGEVDASDRIGSTVGNFKVNESGAATYSIPIATLPGTAGVAPQIALAYSSHGDNGLLGKGWSIDGLSSIARCRQTKQVDGVSRSLTWSVDDRFCLDGQRLVLASGGSYGAVGSVYRTEVESYTRITAVGGTAGNPDYFKVERKDGSVAYFGNSPSASSADAKLINSTNGQALTWALKHVQDSVGNPVWYVYGNGGAGHRISEIRYAYGPMVGPDNYGARLVFNYDFTRPDSLRGFAGGVTLNTSARLVNVISENGGSAFRTYNLSYIASQTFNVGGQQLPLHLSRLQSIQECAGSHCLPATQFTWADPSGQIGFETQSFISSVGSASRGRRASGVTLGDINGDGCPDLIWMEFNQSNASGALRYALSNCQGQFTAAVFTNNAAEIPIDGGTQPTFSIIDYNFDGRMDVLFANSTYGNYVALLSTPLTDGSWRLSADAPIHTGIPLPNAGAPNFRSTTFVDIDSDSLADAVTFGMEPASIRRTIRDTTQAVSSPRYYRFDTSALITATDPMTGFNLGSGELNGDGMVDLFASWGSCSPAGCGYSTRPFLGSETGFTLMNISGLGGWGGAKVGSLMDVNGDGLLDKIFLTGGTATGQTFSFALNNGSGFEAETATGITLIGANWTTGHIDYNADGATDIVFYNNLGVDAPKIQKIALWNKTTQTFDAPFDIYSTVQGMPAISHSYPDLNGDGVADHLVVYDDENILINFGKGRNEARHVITKITNGVGAQTTITYGNLVNSGHYDRLKVSASATDCHGIVPVAPQCPYNKANAADFYTALNGPWMLPAWTQSLGKNANAPVLELFTPMYVVISATSTAPATADNSAALNAVNAAAISTVEYYYGGLKVQGAGRGMLGFERVMTRDLQSGVKTVTTYRQDFPFIGHPLSTEVFAGNGNRIRSSVSWWSFQNWDNNHTLPPYRPVLAFSFESTYDPYLSGNPLLSYVKTSNLYDAFGNATQVKVETFSDVDTTLVARKQTDNTYGATEEERRLGRLTRAVVTQHRPGKTDVIRTSDFRYYCLGGAPCTNAAWRGLLYQEVVEPLKAAYTLTTTHTYDGFGNRASSTVSGSGVTSRTTSWEYDALGRYRNKTTNAKNQVVEQVTARNAFGQPTTVQGLNGTVTQLRYGPLGRQYLQYSNDGSYAVTLRYPTLVGCPAGTAFAETTTKAGGAAGSVCHDKLGRPTRQRTLGFGGGWIHVDTEHDSLGRVRHVTEPYVEGSAVHFTTQTYDVLNRVTAVKRPEDTSALSTTAYAGLTTTFTNAKSQQRIERRNAAGELIEVEDHLGGKVQYHYYADGSLHTTQVLGNDRAAGVPTGPITTTLSYDDLGRKTAMNDPDKGSWTYQYNRFGELILQTDAKGQTSTMTYDVLGRMLTRIDRRADTTIEGNTSWVYDTAANGVGQLDYVQDSVSGYIKAMEYDSLGRVAKTGISLSANDSYFQRVSYDQYGRVYQQYDAAGPLSGTQNVYKSTGYLEVVVDPANTATEFYRVLGLTPRGQVAWEANGAVLAVRQHSLVTGRLEEIKSTVGLNEVQWLTYGYDTLGNLATRRDRSGGKDITETLGYDGLNRLTSQQATGQAAVAVTYDSFGNIKSKTGAGDYSYGSGSNGAGPHAVVSLTPPAGPVVNFSYDANGNNIDGDGRVLKYTTFDKPYEITRYGNKTEMAYGPDRAYYKRIDTSGTQVTTTVYLGNVERVTKVDGSIQLRRYLPGNALLTQTYSGGGVLQTSSTQYVLKDHLGSTDVIVDHTGAVQQAMSFDAWGQRRRANTWVAMGVFELFAFDRSRTSRGFTGHQTLDEVGIIHMNGRIYEPKLGRFLQADPIVDGVTDTQGYNRFAYVRNNPATLIDPTGYSWWSKQRDHIRNFTGRVLLSGGATTWAMYSSRDTRRDAMAEWHPFALQVAGMVVSAFCGPVAAGCAAAWAHESTRAFGGSARDALRAGAIAGASAWAFGQIGDKYSNPGFLTGDHLTKILWHGAVGGTAEVLQGGNFGHGFVSAGLSEFAAPGVDKIMPSSIGPGSAGWFVRVSVAATVGGTVSTITGGKFANGAVTAAFGRAFNGEDHMGTPGGEGLIGSEDLSDLVKAKSLTVEFGISLELDTLIVGVEIKYSFVAQWNSQGGQVCLVESACGSAGAGLYGAAQVQAKGGIKPTLVEGVRQVSESYIARGGWGATRALTLDKALKAGGFGYGVGYGGFAGRQGCYNTPVSCVSAGDK